MPNDDFYFLSNKEGYGASTELDRLRTQRYNPASLNLRRTSPVIQRTGTFTSSSTIANNTNSTFAFITTNVPKNMMIIYTRWAIFKGSIAVANLFPGGSAITSADYTNLYMYGPIDTPYQHGAGATLEWEDYQYGTRVNVLNATGSSQTIIVQRKQTLLSNASTNLK